MTKDQLQAKCAEEMNYEDALLAELDRREGGEAPPTPEMAQHNAIKLLREFAGDKPVVPIAPAAQR